jgi:hypothetical protein
MHRAAPSAARIPIALPSVARSGETGLKGSATVLNDLCAARGVAGVQFVAEIGGGLNLKRPKFVALVDRIEARPHCYTGQHRK